MKSENNLIDWNQKYDLGIEDIDLQHHFFLNLINRLSKDLFASNNPDHQLSLISELNSYANFHFISEENMMREAGYPELETHKKHHFDIIESLCIEGNNFRLEPSQKELEKIISLLVDWFINHTSKEDKLFADYLHQKNNMDSYV
jgi:hemerythrin-like metal-binding protein